MNKINLIFQLYFSNVNQALEEIKKYLKIIELNKYYWPMPKTMIKKIKLLNNLKKKGHIKFEKKYNMLLCYTIIVVCKIK